MASTRETSTEKSNNIPASPANSDENKSSNNNKDVGFECNICLETAHDAVLSVCGHLFCWPCIHQWLEARASSPTCPVCKSAISREKLIPIYGRNSPQTDPRDTIPPRPAGTRHEPSSSSANRNFGEGVHFQMSFGVGAFPFGLFQTTFASNNRPENAHPSRAGPPEIYQQELLSQVFLGIAFVMILFIMFN